MAKQYTPKENNARAAAALTSDPMAVVPPQAVELEEAVLGALMLEKDAVIEVQGLITPEAFYNEAHQIIYKAIVDLSMELKPLHRHRKAQADQEADGSRRPLLPRTADPEGRFGRARRISREDHRPEIRPARTDPRDDRNPEKIVRRGDRRDRPDRFRRG